MIRLKETVLLNEYRNTGFINFLQDGEKSVAVMVRNTRGRVVVSFNTTDKDGKEIVVSTKTNSELFDAMIDRYEEYTYMDNQPTTGLGYNQYMPIQTQPMLMGQSMMGAHPMGIQRDSIANNTYKNTMQEFHEQYENTITKYYDSTMNWVLIECRVFNIGDGSTVHTQLDVIDMNNMEHVQDTIDDVWVYAWEEIK